MVSDPGGKDETVEEHPPERPSADATLPLAAPPETAPLARIAMGKTPVPRVPTLSFTTARDALRDEEISRTRKFIVWGWGLSVMVMGTVPFVDAPRAIGAIFVAGLAIGIVVSIGFYRAFADPRNYTERALITLAMMCVLNGHIAVLFYGAFSGCVMIIVVGVHFIARTELQRVARSILATAMVAYSVIAALIASGAIDDPGVFAADHAIDRRTLVIGAIAVLGTYLLAYYTARAFRVATLTSIEELQRATRLASQREALMEELRADLERALQVGGPGRYTDQTVGHFKLGVVLGRGAMGEVYHAVDERTGDAAAVKLLRRELLGDATQLARFLREVRACLALDSPHVVRVLEAAEEGSTLPYLAMERLHGKTLAELLREQPKLATDATFELCRQTAAGIDAAAKLGVVHRDLKPQNVMLCDGRTWKILDFGVATLAADTGTLTQGDVVGTPHYMAPEQARGQRVDTRADLYALAAIAYRCLTGRHPFNAGDAPALLFQVVHQSPPQPSALADLPGDFDRWCALALAKTPDDRFATGIELVEALADALAGKLDPKLCRRADALVRKHPWEPA